MILGDFAANTPQANYYTLIAGDHAASTEAAAAAYQALSDALAAEMAVMGVQHDDDRRRGVDGPGRVGDDDDRRHVQRRNESGGGLAQRGGGCGHQHLVGLSCRRDRHDSRPGIRHQPRHPTGAGDDQLGPEHPGD